MVTFVVCWHPMVGFTGLLIGPLLVAVIWCVSYFTKDPGASYNIDPQSRPGAFEPLITKYIRASEFIIGLATGSIVLLVGSSVLHAQGGRVPWFYASPLLMLAWSVILGVSFIVWLILQYEGYQHDHPHTRWAYSISETLGFGSLICFCLGYFALILLVTR